MLVLDNYRNKPMMQKEYLRNISDEILLIKVLKINTTWSNCFLMEILKSELFRIVAQRTSVSLAGKEMLD
jgi:hypothetical protein